MFAESTRQYQLVVYSRSDRRLHMVCQLHCLVRVAWRQTIPHTNEEVSLWPTRQVACGGHTERPLRNPESNTYAKRGFQVFNYLCHQKRQCDLNCTMLRRLGPTLRVSLVSKKTASQFPVHSLLTLTVCTAGTARFASVVSWVSSHCIRP